MSLGEWLDVSLPYSKYRHKREGWYAAGFDIMIPTRVGMLCAYTGPLVAFFAVVWSDAAELVASPRLMLLLCLWSMHYFKRLGEVMLVHVYSGEMPLVTTASMVAMYSFVGYALSTVALLGHNHKGANSLVLPFSKLDIADAFGLILWLVGTVGNLTHHIIMSSARRGRGGTKEYVALSKLGGLFGTLTCPHYCFEVMAWFGYALVGRTVLHYTTVTFFSVYLGGRARRTRQWYAERKLL